jgi:hypothetical protein
VKPHQKWFKVILNPLLRKFGWSIVSVFKEDELLGYELRKYPEHCNIKELK